MLEREEIEQIIAIAIRDADKSIFFENYSRQAEAVMNTLDNAGYIILPKELTPNMLRVGKDAILYGRSKPSELVQTIYKALVDSAIVKDDISLI